VCKKILQICSEFVRVDGRRRMTFQDSVTWVKVYTRSAISQDGPRSQRGPRRTRDAVDSRLR
jgi:hypothetical protein